LTSLRLVTLRLHLPFIYIAVLLLLLPDPCGIVHVYVVIARSSHVQHRFGCSTVPTVVGLRVQFSYLPRLHHSSFLLPFVIAFTFYGRMLHCKAAHTRCPTLTVLPLRATLTSCHAFPACLTTYSPYRTTGIIFDRHSYRRSRDTFSHFTCTTHRSHVTPTTDRVYGLRYPPHPCRHTPRRYARCWRSRTPHTTEEEKKKNVPDTVVTFYQFSVRFVTLFPLRFGCSPFGFLRLRWTHATDFTTFVRCTAFPVLGYAL